MADQNKVKGQALQKALREKRRQALLSEMPIGVDELKNLVEIIDSSGCDHTLSATELFLQNYKNAKTILAWFNAHGGYGDCEVVMNIVFGHLAEFDINKKIIERGSVKVGYFWVKQGCACENPFFSL